MIILFPFSNVRCSITAAVYKRFPTVSSAEMEKYIKDWLRHAPARVKQGEKRAARQAADERE